jgi:hypothetical protein
MRSVIQPSGKLATVVMPHLAVASTICLVTASEAFDMLFPSTPAQQL